MRPQAPELVVRRVMQVRPKTLADHAAPLGAEGWPALALILGPEAPITIKPT